MAEIAIIAQSVEKAHVWLDEMADETGTDDRQEAYRVLRAYLHALRDRLPVDEAAQLAAQLDGETEASYAVSSAAKVLRRHVSTGELDDIRAVLPDDLKVILS